MIRGNIVRVVSIRAGVAHHSMVVFVDIGILCVFLINIRVSLVGPFMPYFFTNTGQSSNNDHSSHSGVQLPRGSSSGCLDEVVILCQPNLLLTVQLLRVVINMEPATVPLESVLIVRQLCLQHKVLNLFG